MGRETNDLLNVIIVVATNKTFDWTDCQFDQ